MLYKKGETAHSEHLHRAPRATGHGVSVEGKAHSALGEQLGEPLEAATHGTTHAMVLEGVLKTAHRAQHMVGDRAHRAEVVLNLACWTRSSRKQAPACYTSARQHAGRCETGARLGTRGPHLHMLPKGITVTGTKHGAVPVKSR